ncbi:triose-phosphate isomerase ['Elaeagnus angustifolia' witches'-broom phytoplasma]|uniref:Triosephosphate isomerase n=1 Tax='Elaeagnus angustifolia' witches'-broom phytoplasma TaxID=1538355 RepID=A0ABS5V8G8_9MOLU|nr:triose-phosphate isomerase ['Elaeagnus angustifolia' witches'-broom phytoplasma]MCX2955510.1 triose-phosphate isomerase [Candidatus Phytoplasma australiense]
MNYKPRTKVIAGNWKMYKCKDEALEFIQKVSLQVPDQTQVQTLIFPQLTLLDSLAQLQGTNLQVGAQNMFYESEGAFTGEVSPQNLLSLGVKHVLLGHSERRTFFGETDQIVNLKLLSTLKHKLVPTVCVGESLLTKENNQTQVFLDQQLTNIFAGVPEEALQNIIIAYEPVWAIGTGKSATPQDTNKVIEQIRDKVTALYSSQASCAMRIIYGGSVSVANIKTILEQPAIDGILAGKASLQTEDFLFFAQIASKQALASTKDIFQKNDCPFCC